MDAPKPPPEHGASPQDTARTEGVLQAPTILAIDGRNKEAWDLMLSSPEGALSLCESALAEAQDIAYAQGIADAHLNIGWCEYYFTRLSSALASFEKALDAYTALADGLGIMKSLNALGAVYQDMGRYERAMDYYTRSLEEARRRGNCLREAITLGNIGEVCLELGEVKEALDYFLRAYETAPSDDDSELLSSVLVDIGSAYQRMENWALAGEFAEKALGHARIQGNRQIEGKCLHILGLNALASGQSPLAEKRYLEALSIFDELKNERERAWLLLDLGSILAERGDAAGALDRFREALDAAERIGAKSLVNSAYERLSTAYEMLGDYERSLRYYKSFSRYERQALGEDASRKIKNITVEYEVDKSRQEAEIYRLKNIELKQKTEELERANLQILAIAETGRRITSSLDLDTVINTIFETLQRYIPFDLFGLALYDEAENSLDYRAYIEGGKRIQRARISPDMKRSFAAYCLKNRATVYLADKEKEKFQYIEGEPISYGPNAGSLMYLPLIIDERVIGLITVQSAQRLAITSDHLALVKALAPYIAIAVENSIIHDRLAELNLEIRGEKEELEKATVTITHLANHDPLTGLPNRRLLFELLQKTFDIAARNETKVGVIYIDLDDFKPINDRLGHMAGDRALVAVAGRLRSMLRASDTVARVGGDEFVAVLARVKDRKDISLTANKILKECGKSFEIDGVPCKVGFSMGIAVFPDDGTSIERVVSAADAAMYSVKRDRKNDFAFAVTASEGHSALAAERRMAGRHDSGRSKGPQPSPGELG
jgi:diguanylate cyclase (GGDEF) domain